jgi:hypothetical protein
VYGRHHTNNAEHWRAKVRHGNANANGRVLRFAGCVHHSTLSLDDGIHGFGRARIVVAAKTGNGAINEFRIHLAYPAIAHSKPIKRPTAVIFNQYIALSHKVSEDGSRFRMLQVQSNAEFVAEAIDRGDGYVICTPANQACAICSKIGSIFAARISAGRIFNFDHASAKPGEQESCKRSSQCNCQIKDGNVIQGFGECGCFICFLFPVHMPAFDFGFASVDSGYRVDLTTQPTLTHQIIG